MNALGAARHRWAARLDAHGLLDSRLAARALGSAQLLAGRLPLPVARKLKLLSAASRRIDGGLMLEQCRRALRPWLEPPRVAAWREHRIGWDRYHGGSGDIRRKRELSASLLLKEPGPNGEKGVLYCSFEYNWMKLVDSHDARRLFDEYLFVGASSVSPGDHRVLANLCGLARDPLFICVSNPADLGQYELFAPHIQSLPIMACDWLDADDFHPLPQKERSIDILMVAHFARRERHWILFEALRKLRPDLRVTLIGRTGAGHTGESLRADAKAFGVRQELDILANLEFGAVVQHLCNARVTLRLTRRAGSGVALTESMFANTPVVVMEGAHIGAAAYVNQHTGRKATRANLPRVLTDLIQMPGLCAPRPWAIDNISARITSRKLNTLLRQYCERSGQPWTRDIAPLCWRNAPCYLDAVDKLRLRAGVERLRAQHGVVLEEFASERRAPDRQHRKAS